jgi:hypothetical protein
VTGAPRCDDLGHPVPRAGPARRVVSLVPSLTESVAATRPEALVGAIEAYWAPQKARSYSPITIASHPRSRVGQRRDQGRGLRAARPGQCPAVAGIEELGRNPPVPGH